ncbi:hypothetical protein D3C81_1494690 [compost metagenome]
MINSPKAQLERRVTIHRLDTDEDEAWDGVMELLTETDGLEMTFNDDGSVALQWSAPKDDDLQIEAEEVESLEDLLMERAEVPAPF